uniref:E2 ubiquitin-conjugating enzyme n=1 Tax=Araucaria cunninghamii TaxID=56994 RepID=A0A0D6QXV8_ARACU
MAENENLPPKVIKEIAKELRSLDETPPEGIKVVLNEDSFSTIFADIEGPAGTPYENGVFRMKLVLTPDFPHSPPKGYFVTKIFHPNIANNGEICVNTLKKDWRPNLGLRHVLLVIRCLLIEPFPESALNEQAGKMLMEDYEAYARHARLYTSLHALKPKMKNKGVITESAALNEGPTNNIVSGPPPLLPCTTTNKENNNQDSSMNVVAAESIGVGASMVQKKKDLATSTKVPVDKKKLDARKKSLKRL